MWLKHNDEAARVVVEGFESCANFVWVVGEVVDDSDVVFCPNNFEAPFDTCKARQCLHRLAQWHANSSHGTPMALEPKHDTMTPYVPHGPDPGRQEAIKVAAADIPAPAHGVAKLAGTEPPASHMPKAGPELKPQTHSPRETRDKGKGPK